MGDFIHDPIDIKRVTVGKNVVNLLIEKMSQSCSTSCFAAWLIFYMKKFFIHLFVVIHLWYNLTVVEE